MIVISNGKTTIVGAIISNISNIPNLTQGSVQSGEYLPLSFEYSDYNGNYDDAEFIATFTSASGVTASVPVSFDGNFDARVFNVDTTVEDDTITGTVANSTASVYLPNFQRAIALIVTSSST